MEEGEPVTGIRETAVCQRDSKQSQSVMCSFRNARPVHDLVAALEEEGIQGVRKPSPYTGLPNWK